MTIFGVPWNELRLEHLERFLADAEPEPLLWEAKGVQANAGEVRRQVCGFANSHDGGYLIIGAEQADNGAWSLEGVVFPDEPPVWVANVVGNGGVNPYPDGLDTRPFMTTDNRHVAVVRVAPTPTPPCNAHGTVYERVSGRTISVREPLRLAQLFARGDQARKNAESKAHEAARWVLLEGRNHPRYANDRPQFGLSLAAAGYLPDISSRLFTARFDDGVIAAMRQLHSGPRFPDGPRIDSEVRQDSRQFTLVGYDDAFGQSWLVRATWSGAVAVYWVQPIPAARIDILMSGPVREAWTAAQAILGLLAPQGPRYLQLAVAGGQFPGNPVSVESGVYERPPTVAGRGPLPAGVHTSVLDSMERELRRATGEMAHEPNDAQSADERG